MVLALLAAAPCVAGNAEAALAHVPPQAISFVIVPDLARAGADLSETLARSSGIACKQFGARDIRGFCFVDRERIRFER